MQNFMNFFNHMSVVSFIFLFVGIVLTLKGNWIIGLLIMCLVLL